MATYQSIQSNAGKAQVASPHTSSAATSTTSQGQKIEKIEHFVKSQASKVMGGFKNNISQVSTKFLRVMWKIEMGKLATSFFSAKYIQD